MRIPFQMTERDTEILKAVSHHVRLDRRLVEILLFPATRGRRTDSSRASKRLRLLWQHGYLKRISRPINPFYGSQPFVYQLSLKGAQFLAEQSGVPLDQLCYSDKTKLHPMSVDHGLAVAEVRIAIEQKAATHGFTIEASVNETQLKRAGWDCVRITSKEGKREEIPITPDSYFVLLTPRRRWHLFLEVDRSTETVSRIWQRKIRGYKEYILSGKFHKRYGLSWPKTPLRVLVTAPSLERVQNLKAAAENYGSAEASRMFLFAVMNEAVSCDLLTAPIWLRPDDTRRYMILRS